MSRIINDIKSFIIVPDNVDVKINGQSVTVCGKYGCLTQVMHSSINIKRVYEKLIISFLSNVQKKNIAHIGTMSSLIKNMIFGVSNQFERRLQLVGVGYRAEVNDDNLELFLGFSHCINYKIPNSINVKCLNQTEIILRGIDKQLIGQVSANLRSLRPPEPFKGKGIRYVDECVRIKETKKR